MTGDAFIRRARKALEDRAHEQGGSRNREETVTDEGELVPVAVVNPDAATTHVKQRRPAPARPANQPLPPPDTNNFGYER